MLKTIKKKKEKGERAQKHNENISMRDKFDQKLS